jgi:hypothetical protein
MDNDRGGTDYEARGSRVSGLEGETSEEGEEALGAELSAAGSGLGAEEASRRSGGTSWTSLDRIERDFEASSRASSVFRDSFRS